MTRCLRQIRRISTPATDFRTTAETLQSAKVVLENVSKDVLDDKIKHLATKDSLEKMEKNIIMTLKADFHSTLTTHMRWMMGFTIGMSSMITTLLYRSGTIK